MADLIELDVVVRDKGLKASISTVERLERQIIKAAKALDQNSISQVRYNKILLSTKREYEALGLSSQKATSTVRSFAAAQSKATAEAAKENSALKKLKSSYDSVYAAEQKRLRLKKLLRAEVAAGTMTLREAGRELLLYRKHLHETSKGFQFAKNRANKFGMVAQQVGYQVGDFFVQVQSGTSALVAFGQQGTQLAGLLPGVAGAVIGIGLSLGTMLLRTFLDTRDAGKQLEESVKAVGEALDGLSSTTSMLESTLGAPISAATERLQNYLLLLKKAKAQETFKEVSMSFNQLLKEIGTGAEKLEEGSFMQKFILGTKFGPSKEDLNNADYLLKVQRELAEVIKGTAQQPRIVQTSADIAALGDDLLAFSEKHGGVMNERIKGVLLETGLIQLMADELSYLADDQAKAGEEHNDQVEATNANLDAQLELMMKQYAEQQNIDAIANKTLSTLINQEQLIGLQLKHGNDSIEVEQKKSDMTRAAFEEALNKEEVEDEILTTIMLQYDKVQSLLASNEKLTSEKAAQLALDQRSLSISGQQRTGTLTLYGGRGAMTPEQRALEKRNAEEGKKTSGAKPTTMEGPFKALERQIELSKALFGLQGAARREEEIYMQLKFQNQDADIKVGKEGLELLAERVALEEQRTKAEQMNLKNIGPLKKYVAEYAKLVKLKDSGLGDEAFAKEVAKLNEELAKSNPLLNSFTDAFADFLGRGARDFKSFAKDILNDFKSMLVQMITTAARNKIMFSMGMGGGALGTAAAAGGGGTGSSTANLGVLGNAVSSFAGSGIASGFSSALGLGGYASQGLFNVAANAQVAAAAGASTMAASIGAAIPPLLAIGAAFSFLRTKTKELDSGLRVTVDNMDVLVNSFKIIQKSRFFGLSKKVRTSEEEASSDISDPIVNAVVTIQESVMEAASAFGVASDKFNDFTYDFEVSLKGLTEDQKVEKLNEEFAKLGDTFTEMSGLFNNMNDLMAVYQQRLELEKQLLVAQGDVVKLREQELETIHVLNRALAARLQLMQAEDDVQSAIQGLVSAISERQGLIRKAVDALVSPLQEALNRFKDSAQNSYDVFKEASGKARTEAKALVDILRGALNSRKIKSEAVELQSYRKSQQQLTAFAGGAEFDKESLGKAAQGVSIDSEKFFGSFEDYARDFYKTQITLEELEAKAAKELTDVDVQIAIAEKAYQMAMNTYQESVDMNTALDTLLTDLAAYNEVSNRNEPLIEQIKAEGDRQIAAFDKVLEEAGLMATSNMSVAAALEVLGVKEGKIAGAVTLLKKPVEDIGSHMENFDASLAKAYDDLGLTINDLVALDIAGKLKTLNFFAPLENVDFTAIDEETLKKLSEIDLATLFNENVTDLSTKFNLGVDATGTTIANKFNETVEDLSGDFNENADLKKALDKSGLEAALTENANLLGKKSDNLNAKIIDFSETANTAIDNLASTIGADDTTGLSGSVTKLGASAKEAAAALADAMTGPDGLSFTVSSLSTAIDKLADSNTALASAKEAVVTVEKVSTITTEAAAIVAALEGIDIPDVVEVVASKYKSGLFGDKASTATLSTGDVYSTKVGRGDQERLNAVALAQTAADEMNLKRDAPLAEQAGLEADLEALRQQIRDLGGTATFATGGYHSGGMRMVGENGPELEVTGPSRIYSAQQTKNMLSGGSGEVVVELRSLRREVSELKAEQRKVGVENVKYNKKSYDLYREWDTVGLPATRTA